MPVGPDGAEGPRQGVLLVVAVAQAQVQHPLDGPGLHWAAPGKEPRPGQVDVGPLVRPGLSGPVLQQRQVHLAPAPAVVGSQLAVALPQFVGGLVASVHAADAGHAVEAQPKVVADGAEGAIPAVGLVGAVVLVAPEGAQAFGDGLAGLPPGDDLVGVQGPAEAFAAVASPVPAVELEDDAVAGRV